MTDYLAGLTETEKITAMRRSSLEPLTRVDILTAFVKVLARAENMLRRCSDIEGGIKTLGQGADIHSVRRIRTAERELNADIDALADDLIKITAALDLGKTAENALIDNMSLRLEKAVRAKKCRRKCAKPIQEANNAD